MIDVRRASAAAAVVTMVAAALAAIVGRSDTAARPPDDAIPADHRTAGIPAPRVAFDALRRDVPIAAVVGGTTTNDPTAAPRTIGRVADRSFGTMIEGLVCLADGQPARLARVALGPLGVRCDTNGRFALFASGAVSPSDDLVAWLAGSEPAVLPDFGGRIPAPTAFRTIGPVRLDLGGPTRTVRGRVVDREGRPQKGWQVATLAVAEPGAATALGRCMQELLVGGDAVSRTDEYGEFRIDGLLRGSRRLIAQRGGRRVEIELDPSRSDPIAIVVE